MISISNISTHAGKLQGNLIFGSAMLPVEGEQLEMQADFIKFNLRCMSLDYIQFAFAFICYRQGDDWLRKRQAVRSLMLKPASMDRMAGEIEDICTDMCTHIADQRDSQGYISCLPDHLYRFSFEGKL